MKHGPSRAFIINYKQISETIITYLSVTTRIHGDEWEGRA